LHDDNHFYCYCEAFPEGDGGEDSPECHSHHDVGDSDTDFIERVGVLTVQIGILVVIRLDFYGNHDDGGVILYVVGGSERLIGIMGVGGQLKGDPLILHIDSDVVNDDPEAVAVLDVPCVVVLDHAGDVAGGHPAALVDLVEPKDVPEVDIGPFLDLLVEFELQLERVVALIFSDPDGLEGNG
jgi:hypothetical protein